MYFSFLRNKLSRSPDDSSNTRPLGQILTLVYVIPVLLVSPPVAVPGGYYLSYWNIPTFSYGATDTTITDKSIYNTIVRLGLTYTKMGVAFKEIFQSFGWDSVVLLTRTTLACDYGARAIVDTFASSNITVSEWMRVEPGLTDREADMRLDNFRERGRSGYS